MKNNGKKPSAKQIAAMACVVILAALYVLTLICAVFNFPGSDRLFRACLFATVGLPILLWIYIWLYQKVQERKAQAEEERKAREERK